MGLFRKNDRRQRAEGRGRKVGRWGGGKVGKNAEVGKWTEKREGGKAEGRGQRTEDEKMGR
jgi:hypothetical protein